VQKIVLYKHWKHFHLLKTKYRDITIMLGVRARERLEDDISNPSHNKKRRIIGDPHKNYNKGRQIKQQ